MNQQELIECVLMIEQQLEDMSIEMALLNKLGITMPCDDAIHLIINEDATMTIYIDYLHLTNFVYTLYHKLCDEFGAEDIRPVTKGSSRGVAYFQITLLNEAPRYILEIINHSSSENKPNLPIGLATIPEETEEEIQSALRIEALSKR